MVPSPPYSSVNETYVALISCDRSHPEGQSVIIADGRLGHTSSILNTVPNSLPRAGCVPPEDEMVVGVWY